MSGAAIDGVIAEIRAVYGRWGRGTTVGRMRADWDELFRARAAPMEVRTFDAGGVSAAWIDPVGSAPERVIVYFHGGGFRLGSIASHLDLMQRLGSAAAARVLAVDYRLAPEHQFPAPVEDALAAYRWLLEQGVAPAHVAFAGDSAGGGLAVSAMFAARARSLELPCAAVLMSAWTDLAATGRSHETCAKLDPIHSQAMILAVAKGYLGPAGNPRDPLASPLYGDLHGLPPLLLQCGGRETVLDDSIMFAERARAAGVAVELEVHTEMIHVFQMFADELDDARQAISAAGAFLRRRFDPPACQ